MVNVQHSSPSPVGEVIYQAPTKRPARAKTKPRKAAAAEAMAAPMPSNLPEPAVDPVVQLWPELEAATFAFCQADEAKDKAAHEALDDKLSKLSDRLVSMTPTTSAGIALQLRFLAHTEGHEHEGFAHTYECRIVQNLVRLLSGDPTWTAATDPLATMGK